jgi:hypothetical protein
MVVITRCEMVIDESKKVKEVEGGAFNSIEDVETEDVWSGEFKWGDDMREKEGGTLRIMGQNVRGMLNEAGGRERRLGVRTEDQRWMSYKAQGVDLVLLSDTGMESAKNIIQRGLYQEGAVRMKAQKWGGAEIRFVSEAGYKKRGKWYGGVLVAAVECLKPGAGRVVVDPRGWGRFVATEWVGANGTGLTTAVVYAAGEGSSNWQRQVALMQNLREELGRKKEQERTAEERETWEHLQNNHELEGRAVGGTPMSLLLRDLARVIKGIGTEYVLVMGDWNVTPPGLKDARSGKVRVEADEAKEVMAFMSEMELVEGFEERHHRGEGGQRGVSDRARRRLGVPRTWMGAGKSEGQWSWIDYALLSKKLWERGLVRKVGVTQDTSDGSDHGGTYVDLDWEGMMGRSKLWEDIREQVRARRRDDKQRAFKAVKLTDAGRVKAFVDAVTKKEQSGRAEQVMELMERARGGGLDRQGWGEAEGHMAYYEELLVSGQTAVLRTLPQTGGVRKQWYSKEYVEIARKARMISRFTKAWRRGLRGRRLVEEAGALAKKVGGLPKFSGGLTLPCINLETHRWKEWMGKLEGVVGQLQRRMHGKNRKRMRQARDDRRKRLTGWVEENELGKAFDNVLRRVRDGAADTAVIKEADGRRRAAISGEEVREHHYRTAREWMGEGKKRWFYAEEGRTNGREVSNESGMRHRFWAQDEQGKQAQRRLAEGELTEEDLEATPEAFHGFLKYLRRAWSEVAGRRVEEGDYEGSGLGEEITRRDWEAFWGQAAPGKRGGDTGVHATLIKALYKKEGEGEQPGRRIGETLRRLVNIARVSRRDYRSWKEELLYFFIKNPGTCGLENCRPVGLLEVLFKCSEAFDAAAMLSVWTRMGLVTEEQWAYLEGKGCDGPLLMWTLMGEEAYLHKIDYGDAEVDSEKAFDSPTPEAVAIMQRAMGVPEWRVEQELERKRQTNTRVITPFGLTERFRRVQGIAQGGTSSPAIWMMMSFPLTWYLRAEGRLAPGRVPDEYGEEMEMRVQLLADDEGIPAMGEGMVEGLEQRVALSATWGNFFGVSMKASKSWAAIGEWSEEANAERRRMLEPDEHGKVVRIRDTFRGRVEELRTVGPYENNRILGQQRSLGQYSGVPLEKAMEELETTTRAVQKMPKYGWLAVRVAEGVGWRRLAYRLLYVYAFPEEVERGGKRLKKAVLDKIGLAPGTPLGVLYSSVWGSSGDMMAVERLTVMMRQLNAGDMRGRGLAGAIQRLQQYVGCSAPVLETDWFRCRCGESEQRCGGDKGCWSSCGWSGTWVGMLYHTLSKYGIQVKGGLGLPEIRIGDKNLVDEAVVEDKDMVREGCRRAGVWRTGEVLELEGMGMRRAFRKGGPMEKAAGREWVKWVNELVGCRDGVRRRLVRGGGQEGRGLGGWWRSAIWSWQVAVWVEEGVMKVGKPVGWAGDRLKVQVMREIEWGKHRTKEEWDGITMSRTWYGKGQSQWLDQSVMWEMRGGGVQPVVEIEVERVRPAEWERWESTGGAEPVQFYRLAELHKDTEAELEGRGGEARAQRGVRWVGGIVGDRVEGEWGEELIGQVLGASDERLRRSGRLRAECSKWGSIEEGQWEGVLKVYTDGGAKGQGKPEATAYYGGIVAGTGEATQVREEFGGTGGGRGEWMPPPPPPPAAADGDHSRDNRDKGVEGANMAMVG